jgi:hypothetical protein
MKSSLLSFLLLGALSCEGVHAQGPLTPPPGPPAPNMKSLDQIEPAIPLVAGQPGVSVAPSGTIAISQAGSYYLTGPLTVTGGNGISVQADDVSVNLRGFTISSSGTGGRGIDLSHTRISIRNGTVRGNYVYSGGAFSGSGFDGGVDYLSAPGNALVEDMLVEGVQSYGIDLGPFQASVVRSCVVRTASILGIRAGVVADSAALIVGVTPINAGQATGCVGKKADGSSFIDAPTPQSDQRIPISSVPYVISQAGSYYMTRNLNVSSGDAITINNIGGVSLDMGGFALTSSSGGASGAAIQINGLVERISIRNGTIGAAAGSTLGFLEGIRGLNAFQTNVANVQVDAVKNYGIRLTVSTLVQNCAVMGGEIGINAGEIRDSTALYTNGDAMQGGIIDRCQGLTTGTSDGFGIYGILVTNSIGVSGTGCGIRAESASHCKGTTQGTVVTSVGMTVTGTADNCNTFGAGGSSTALKAAIAIGCNVTNGLLDVPVAKRFNM